MLILAICLVILIILLAKTKIEISYLENKFKFKFIFFEVIKIKLKAKTKRVKRKVKEVARKKLDLKVLGEIVYHNLYIFRYILSKIEMNIKVECIFSIYSPDKTAITYGLINPIIYSLHTLLSCTLKEYNGQYSFKPNFNNNNEGINIKIGIESKIGIRNIQIVVIGCRMLPKLLEYRKKVKIKRRKLNESPDRRFNENYNG
jgi:hypothetical protein